MPPVRTSRSNQRNPAKIIILLTLITIITSASSITLSSYPQHIWLSNTTKLGDIQFADNNTAIIKGSQVSFSANQVIPLEGRSYIRITANQAQIGGNTFQEGIRTVFAEWNQNIIQQQPIGTFGINQVAQAGIDTTVINLIPISGDVININTADLTGKATTSNYNIQFVQNTVYISEGGALLKLQRSSNNIAITLIGSGYKNIWMRII